MGKRAIHHKLNDLKANIEEFRRDALAEFYFEEDDEEKGSILFGTLHSENSLSNNYQQEDVRNSGVMSPDFPLE